MMQYHDIMEPDTAYVSMRFGAMQGNPMQLLFFETTVKLKLELGLRCLCEETC